MGPGKLLFTRQAHLPAALSAAGWTMAPPPTEVCLRPHPRDLRPQRRWWNRDNCGWAVMKGLRWAVPRSTCASPRPSQSLGGEGGRQGRHRGGAKAEWAGPRRAGEGLAPGKGGGAGSAPPPGGNAPPIA